MLTDRREALALLTALGASAWLRAGHAQRVYRIAVLIHGTESTQGPRLAALRAGLSELGYVEGRNVVVSVRWNEGGLDRLPDLAAELLRDKPDLVVAAPVFSAVAVHKHTRTVPIVMATGAGALQAGLAASLARPGGNVTGMTNQIDELIQKQIEFLHAISPGISRLGVLTTGQSPVHNEMWRDAMSAAQSLKVQLVEVRIGAPADLTRLASVCGKGSCQALLVFVDASLINWRAQVIDWAARLRLPAMYPYPEATRDGGLISYSADVEAMYRRSATYVDGIFKGAKPGELPIERPTKFELVINLNTAKALGITIPQSLLLRASTLIH